MIKLLWNTHNQNKYNPKENDEKDLADYNWGIYHKKNSNQWIFSILSKVSFKPIYSEKDLKRGDVLIVVDSSVEKKEELYIKLRSLCSEMFLIHLGDESGANDLTSIYNNFNFVWRSFCLNKFFNIPNQNI